MNKYTILYNGKFPLNHPELHKKYSKLGECNLINYKKYNEYLKTPEELMEIVRAVDDFFDIVPRGQRELIGDLKLSEALTTMLSDPKKYLISVIGIQKYKDITLIDCGMRKVEANVKEIK